MTETPKSDSDSSAAVTVVGPAAVPAALSGRIVEEALGQLRKLGELREEELKRHELVVAEMREHVRRHAGANRLLVLLSLGMLALIAVLAAVLHQLQSDQRQAREAISAAVGEVTQLSGVVQAATTDQEARINNLTQAFSANMQKLDAVQAGVDGRVDAAMSGLRQERDAITGGIRMALDDQHRQMIDKEVALRAEEQRVRAEMEQVRIARQKIIQEAIDKLSALSKQEAPAAGAAGQ